MQLQIYLELYLVCHLSPVDRFQSDDKDDGDQGEVAGYEHQEAGMVLPEAVTSLCNERSRTVIPKQVSHFRML